MNPFDNYIKKADKIADKIIFELKYNTEWYDSENEEELKKRLIDMIMELL